MVRKGEEGQDQDDNSVEVIDCYKDVKEALRDLEEKSMKEKIS